MKINLTQELREICSRLEIDAHEHISYRGALFNSSDESIVKYDFLTRLAQFFYDQCYLRDRGMDGVFENENCRDLTPLLMQENATKANWDHGWEVYQTGSEGRAYVKKADRSRLAYAGTYVGEKLSGVTPKIGDRLSLRIYPENCELQAAFFHSFGSTLADQFDDFSAVRFYFNVEANGAVALLSDLSTRLNQFYIPFHFKTLVSPAHYRRADAAVLYIARRNYSIVASLISEIETRLAHFFVDEIPLFCKEFAPGIGVAEDPGTGESFGMHRCWLVAEGILHAHKEGEYSTEGRMSAIEKNFALHGLSLERAHLNLRSSDLISSAHFSEEHL